MKVSSESHTRATTPPELGAIGCKYFYHILQSLRPFRKVNIVMSRWLTRGGRDQGKCQWDGIVQYTASFTRVTHDARIGSGTRHGGC